MLFEKLSEKDTGLIQSYLDEYGANPGSFVRGPQRSLDYLLRFWDAAKSEWLYHLMGQNFILEKSVEYTKPSSLLEKEIAASCARGKMHAFRDAYFRKMDIIFKPEESYWSSNEYILYSSLISAYTLAQNGFCENQITEPSFLSVEGNKIKIESTTKPMRVLRKIAKIIGEEKSFEEFRLEHSRILNQKRFCGTLCLSIHPMDYMTMSDNSSKWTSCMSWSDTGGYRMGTVEMMNSPCVIVGYLKSDNSSYFDWNDKHWRTLLIASPDIITSVKAYPYQCDELTRMCVEWIRELGAANLGWNFNEVDRLYEGGTFEYVDNNYYHFEADTDVMYNDFDNEPVIYGALPHVIPYSSTPEDPYRLHLNYSGKTECMYCGDDMSGGYSYDESYIYCEGCCSDADDDDDYICDHCGRHWDYSDMYEVDGDYICPDCIDDVAAIDILDGCWHYKNWLVPVYLTRKDDEVDKASNLFVFMSEGGLLPEWDHLVKVDNPRRSPSGFYYFNRADLTEQGLRSWFHLYSWNSTGYFSDEK